MTRKKRLGRGLEALLNSTSTSRPGEATAVIERPPGSEIQRQHNEPSVSVQPLAPNTTLAPVATNLAQPSATPDAPMLPEEGAIIHLNVYDVEDNPFQPRRSFDESEIATLAESLKEHDILQPILVRIVDGQYQLISGERRLRAAIKANWKTIPARLRSADDRLVSELAIVENLQRKDLNPIEKAISFRRYIDEHNCKQEELANRLKIDRSTVANLMRLLELPAPIQSALQSGQISAGHARALLPLGEEQLQIEFCNQIISQGISVRATERAVSEKITAEDSSQPPTVYKIQRTCDPQTESIQQELKQAIGTKVVVKPGARQKGKIVLYYANHEEFERLRELLMGTANKPKTQAA